MPNKESPTLASSHDGEWWGQFETATGQFDAAILTTGLTEMMLPKILARLLQREADIAADMAIAYHNKPGSDALQDRHEKAGERLRETIDRLRSRDVDPDTLIEAEAVWLVIDGQYAAAAAAAEPWLGTLPLLRVFVSALRMEHLDINVTAQLLNSGATPAEAIHVGKIIGKYGWWPDWMRELVLERAMADTLDDALIAALDLCAFATLRPTQARLARSLLRGDQAATNRAVRTLQAIGETATAERLRDGDLTAVAFAARFASV
ncbi:MULTISPECIES: hypothetical protein [Actinoplanes]|uniref:hypothetical protein n=1 Tax=Actinoplanes TaxID=1865 RepID=UPI0005F2F137|nr:MULTISPECIES: hypothetical protein [Actinoplanes]GLY02975.1 hypothetical protein Acsp01_33540 [Actinoplanes sp. NBRC 101535]